MCCISCHCTKFSLQQRCKTICLPGAALFISADMAQEHNGDFLLVTRWPRHTSSVAIGGVPDGQNTGRWIIVTMRRNGWHGRMEDWSSSVRPEKYGISGARWGLKRNSPGVPGLFLWGRQLKSHYLTTALKRQPGLHLVSPTSPPAHRRSRWSGRQKSQHQSYPLPCTISRSVHTRPHRCTSLA